MAKIIVASFSDSQRAGEAVGELNNKGYTDAISVVAKDESPNYIDTQIHKIKENNTGSVGTGAIAGAILGGIAALLIGTAAVGLPGGLVVIGPIATALLGTAGGATVGALAGALVDMGVPEDQVQVYADRMNAGDVIIIVQSDATAEGEVEEIFKNHHAELIEKYE